MTPLMTHDSRKSPGEPTSRAISAATIKMPDPIIEPITIVVQSSSPSPLTSSADRAPGPVADLFTTVAAMLPFLNFVIWPSRGGAPTFRRTSAERLQEFSRPRPDVLRGQQAMDHGHRIRSSFDDGGRIVKRYSADGHQGLARQPAHFAQSFETDHRVGTLLGGSAENRSKGDVVG